MQKKLTISQKGIDLIKGFEGIHDGNRNTSILEPKKDPSGYWTLGFGSRYDFQGREVTRYTPAITMAQAEQLLRRDVGIAGDYINRMVIPQLNQNQFDALCSLVFNIGTGNFRISRLLRSLNSGLSVVEQYFSSWRKSKGVILPGLVTRRAKEYLLYRTPV